MNLPPNMFLVQPSGRGAASAGARHAQTANPLGELRVGQSQFFRFAVPPGWRLGEDGQFAFTLVAPDQQALTVLVGNSGLFPGTNPMQFVYEKLSAMQPQGLQLGQAQPAQPIAGFQQAVAMPLQYHARGRTYLGIATCQINQYYGGMVMAMTAAIAEASQWPQYASWLPQVSTSVAATNGAAFGIRGVMQQNLQNSITFGNALREYREWSQRTQQQVADERGRSVDRQHAEFRENLGAVQTYHNPYGSASTVELSTQYQYYWTNRQGEIAGTNDPGVDPNQGNTGEWTRMQQLQR